MFSLKLQKIILIVFLAVIVGSLLLYNTFDHNLDLEQVRHYLENCGIWAPIVFILAFAIVAIFLPSTPFMAIAGILFGIKYGFIYAIAGCLISAIVVFSMSRRLGKGQAEKILEHKYLKVLHKYNGRLESGGIWDLTVMRILPVMPFNVLNILMGVSKIKTENYLLGTILGLVPSTFVAVCIGDIILKIL